MDGKNNHKIFNKNMDSGVFKNSAKIKKGCLKMTIEVYENAKKLREEIGRLNAIKKSLSEHDAELNIFQGYTVSIKRNSALHEGVMMMLQTMINSLEIEFEQLGGDKEC